MIKHRSPVDFFMEELGEKFRKRALSTNGAKEDIAQACLDETRDEISKILSAPVVGEAGYWKGDYRLHVVGEAQTWAAEGHSAFYCEIDIRNVGGANAVLGHSKCNTKVFLPLAQIVRRCIEEGIAIRNKSEERQKVLLANMLGEGFFSETEIEQIIAELKSAWVEFFRHGGDELSFVVVGIPKRMLTVLLDQAHREVAAYEEEAGLKFLPHPKHLFSFERHWGVSISYGFAVIKPGVPIEDIFEDADTRVEKMKKKGKVSYGRGSGKSAKHAPRYSWREKLFLWKLALQTLRS